MKPAYYNEIDAYCAAWLRNLIEAGLIPAGEVDERDIREVAGDDLKGYGQCHFFAGIGGWAEACRLAGIPDDRPVWTASCPCPPFSVAGKQKTCPVCGSALLVSCPRRTGFFICADCGHAWDADPRHLWPEAWRLIAELRPTIVFGEQVESVDGRRWFAGVRGSLEILGYAAGASDLCAAGVGAPHIRQRLWWVAYADGGHPGPEGLQRGGKQRQQPQDGRLVGGLEHASGNGRLERRAEPSGRGVAGGRSSGGMGNPKGRGTKPAEQPRRLHGTEQTSEIGGLAKADGKRRQQVPGGTSGHEEANGRAGRQRREQDGDHVVAGHGQDGFWDAFDLIPCGDGKSRRVEPGTFPLDHGIPARVGKLRAYGNSICPQVAAEFMMATMEAI